MRWLSPYAAAGPQSRGRRPFSQQEPDFPYDVVGVRLEPGP